MLYCAPCVHCAMWILQFSEGLSLNVPCSIPELWRHGCPSQHFSFMRLFWCFTRARYISILGMKLLQTNFPCWWFSHVDFIPFSCVSCICSLSDKRCHFLLATEGLQSEVSLLFVQLSAPVHFEIQNVKLFYSTSWWVTFLKCLIAVLLVKVR